MHVRLLESRAAGHAFFAGFACALAAGVKALAGEVAAGINHAIHGFRFGAHQSVDAQKAGGCDQAQNDPLLHALTPFVKKQQKIYHINQLNVIFNLFF